MVRFTGRNKFEGRGRAPGNTGGLQAIIQPVLAHVALYYSPRGLIPLGGPPRTCRDTGLATDAFVGFDKHNAVFGPLLHGARGAGGNAPGLFTMKAGHEYEIDPRDAVFHSRPYTDDLAQARTDGYVVCGLAMDFAGLAPDAPILILINVVAAHKAQSFAFSSLEAFRTFTKQSPIGQFPPTATFKSPFMRVLSLMPFL